VRIYAPRTKGGEWTRGVVCDAYHSLLSPRTARYCVYMHIYRGKPPDSPLYSNSAAFSDIPAETLDRKAPAFESPPPPVIHRPRNPLSTSRRFLSLSRRGHPAHSRRLSYATSSRHIRIKSNVFRLNGFVSVVFDYPLFLSPLSLRFSCHQRGRNIYYKPTSPTSEVSCGCR